MTNTTLNNFTEDVEIQFINGLLDWTVNETTVNYNQILKIVLLESSLEEVPDIQKTNSTVSASRNRRQTESRDLAGLEHVIKAKIILRAGVPLSLVPEVLTDIETQIRNANFTLLVETLHFVRGTLLFIQQGESVQVKGGDILLEIHPSFQETPTIFTFDTYWIFIVTILASLIVISVCMYGVATRCKRQRSNKISAEEELHHIAMPKFLGGNNKKGSLSNIAHPGPRRLSLNDKTPSPPKFDVRQSPTHKPSVFNRTYKVGPSPTEFGDSPVGRRSISPTHPMANANDRLGPKSISPPGGRGTLIPTRRNPASTGWVAPIPNSAVQPIRRPANPTFRLQKGPAGLQPRRMSGSKK